eukprot:10424750-Alexandrium_andersonii.AAC.1
MPGGRSPVRAAMPPAAASWQLPGRPRLAALLPRAPGPRAPGRVVGAALRAPAWLPALCSILVGLKPA